MSVDGILNRSHPPPKEWAREKYTPAGMKELPRDPFKINTAGKSNDRSK